jgi:hypothetical protein
MLRNPAARAMASSDLRTQPRVCVRPLAAAAGPRQWEFPTVACRSCLVLWVFRPVGPVAPGTCLPSAVCRFPQPAPPSRWQTVRCSPHRHHLLPSGSSSGTSIVGRPLVGAGKAYACARPGSIPKKSNGQVCPLTRFKDHLGRRADEVVADQDVQYETMPRAAYRVQ